MSQQEREEELLSLRAQLASAQEERDEAADAVQQERAQHDDRVTPRSSPPLRRGRRETKDKCFLFAGNTATGNTGR